MSNTGLPPVRALVLAAGAGSRLGGRPKGLLCRQGVPLIRSLVVSLAHATSAPVIVVLGHHAAQIAPVLSGLPVTLVHNPDPAAEQASSLRLGLQAQTEAAAATLVALADQPLVGTEEITALLAAYARRPPGSEFVQPVVAGVPGNPVVFSPAVRAALLAAEPPISGRQWQDAHPAQVWRWMSDMPGYTLDIDTPEDLAAFAARTGEALRWPAE